jgi:hypothetical protein
VYPQSGYIARAVSNYEPYGELDEDVIIEKEIDPKLDFGIKTIEPYTIYIVSYQFAMKLKNINFKNKHQFVYPCSCKAERDDSNKKEILNVPSLIAVM